MLLTLVQFAFENVEFMKVALKNAIFIDWVLWKEAEEWKKYFMQKIT